MLDNIKIKKKKLNSIKTSNKELEEGIIDQCRPRHRLKKEEPYKKYKKLFQTTSYCAIFSLILSSVFSVYFVFARFDIIPPERLKIVAIGYYIMVIIMCFVPYIPLHVLVMMKSILGRTYISKKYLKLFYKKMDKVIIYCHQHSELMLVAKNNVQLEYFTETSQLFSRQALLRMLRMTNLFIREKYYDVLRFKQKRELANKVETYLKELHGALIMTYKGRIPKYVSDAFQQIAMNLIELRKKEALL